MHFNLELGLNFVCETGQGLSLVRFSFQDFFLCVRHKQGFKQKTHTIKETRLHTQIHVHA